MRIRGKVARGDGLKCVLGSSWGIGGRCLILGGGALWGHRAKGNQGQSGIGGWGERGRSTIIDALWGRGGTKKYIYIYIYLYIYICIYTKAGDKTAQIVLSPKSSIQNGSDPQLGHVYLF